MANENENLPNDDVRLCPICRSSISVWATKCKHCGAEVGRPRAEETQLTLKDLGGEQKNTYTVSGNVMDALESFRADELSAQEEEFRRQDEDEPTWFGKRKAGEEAGSGSGERERLMPELDSYHKELADGMQESGVVQKREAARRAQQKPAVTKTIFTTASVMAGLVILYLGGSFTYAGIRDYIASRNYIPPPDCGENRAEWLLEQGSQTIEALEVAMNVVDCFDSPENLAIAANVRVQFIAEVDKGLNTKVYDEAALQRLSNWLDRASKVDEDINIQRRLTRVLKDVTDYSLVLSEVDFSNERARFVLGGGSTQGVWIQKDRLISDRFKLTRIRPDHVFIQDTLISNRRLVCQILERVAPER